MDMSIKKLFANRKTRQRALKLKGSPYKENIYKHT